MSEWKMEARSVPCRHARAGLVDSETQALKKELVMEKSSIFWMILILWALGLLYVNFGSPPIGLYHFVGGSVIEFALFVLLGWQVYGKAIK